MLVFLILFWTNYNICGFPYELTKIINTLLFLYMYDSQDFIYCRKLFFLNVQLLTGPA